MTFGPDQLASAIARLEALPDEDGRSAAREALTAVLALHREGLERLLSHVRSATSGGERILQGAAQDELIASLLSLHGLHPMSVEARVRQALDRVHPEREGGSVDVISIDETVVRLRVSGSERLRRTVEQMVAEAAPEMDGIEVFAPAPDLVPVERLVGRSSGRHERCELCGESLDREHTHLLDLESRRLTCACPACSILLDGAGTKLRRVRPEARRLAAFQISEPQWEALKVPVSLAFFYRSSTLGTVVAAYPGPAGAIESAVSEGAWSDLVQANPVLAGLEPDLSALLVHRRTTEPRFWVLSIDACYGLTCLVRSRWEGITGGGGLPRALDEFFGTLREIQP